MSSVGLFSFRENNTSRRVGPARGMRSETYQLIDVSMTSVYRAPGRRRCTASHGVKMCCKNVNALSSKDTSHARAGRLNASTFCRTNAGPRTRCNAYAFVTNTRDDVDVVRARGAHNKDGFCAPASSALSSGGVSDAARTRRGTRAAR